MDRKKTFLNDFEKLDLSKFNFNMPFTITVRIINTDKYIVIYSFQNLRYQLFDKRPTIVLKHH